MIICTWTRLPGESSFVSMTNLDPYQKARAKQRKMMHHKYPWKIPMMEPFLIPQLWASARFLSYLRTTSALFVEVEESTNHSCKDAVNYDTCRLLLPPLRTQPLFGSLTGLHQPQPLPSRRPSAPGPSVSPQPWATSAEHSLNQFSFIVYNSIIPVV